MKYTDSAARTHLHLGVPSLGDRDQRRAAAADHITAGRGVTRNPRPMGRGSRSHVSSSRPACRTFPSPRSTRPAHLAAPSGLNPSRSPQDPSRPTGHSTRRPPRPVSTWRPAEVHLHLPGQLPRRRPLGSWHKDPPGDDDVHRQRADIEHPIVDSWPSTRSRPRPPRRHRPGATRQRTRRPMGRSRLVSSSWNSLHNISISTVYMDCAPARPSQVNPSRIAAIPIKSGQSFAADLHEERGLMWRIPARFTYTFLPRRGPLRSSRAAGASRT